MTSKSGYARSADFLPYTDANNWAINQGVLDQLNSTWPLLLPPFCLQIPGTTTTIRYQQKYILYREFCLFCIKICPNHREDWQLQHATRRCFGPTSWPPKASRRRSWLSSVLWPTPRRLPSLTTIDHHSHSMQGLSTLQGWEKLLCKCAGGITFDYDWWK